MPDFDLRVLIPKDALLDPKKLIRAIENTLDTAADAVRMEFVRTTGSWEHKPGFMIDSYPGRRVIYTDDAIYSYVSHGTQAHIIRPRRARALHFYRTGFRAKSRPDRMVANKGHRANKDETFARVVHHPGIQARNFDKTIQMRWRKFFPKQMQQAIDSEFES